MHQLRLQSISPVNHEYDIVSHWYHTNVPKSARSLTGKSHELNSKYSPGLTRQEAYLKVMKKDIHALGLTERFEQETKQLVVEVTSLWEAYEKRVREFVQRDAIIRAKFCLVLETEHVQTLKQLLD